MTATTFPFTTVWPFRLGGNGFTCATYLAYSGAARDSTTISRNRASAASAMRLRRSRRPASAHGFRPTTAEVDSGPTSACSSRVAMLREPEPVDEDVPLRVPQVTVNVAGQEVDLLRVVHVDPGRRVGLGVVDLRPERGRPGRVGGRHRLGLVDLGLDGLVAECGDVRAGVAVRVDGPAAEQHVQEVRLRSEERRVGKECRSRWSRDH